MYGCVKTVVAHLSTSIGFVTAILVLLDWLLLEQQKSYLRDRAISVWCWLDDQRVGKFLPYLWEERLQSRLVLGYAGLIALMALGLASYSALSPVWGAWTRKLCVAFGCGIYATALFVLYRFLHQPVARALCNSGSVVRYLIIALRKLGLYLLIALVVSSFGSLAARAVTQPFFAFLFVVLAVPAMLATWFELLLLCIVVMSSALWILLVSSTMASIAAGKFVLLRVIDYPKGVLLGLSALLVALGHLLKVAVE